MHRTVRPAARRGRRTPVSRRRRAAALSHQPCVCHSLIGRPVVSRTSRAPDDPADVVRVQPRGRGRIDRREPGVEDRAAEFVGLPLQPAAHGGIDRRTLEQAEEKRFEVERRAADEERRLAPRLDGGDGGLRPVEPPSHVGRLPRVENVDQVVRHAAADGGGRLGRADVHAPIERHRVHRDDLGPESVGEVEGKGRLARPGRAGQDEAVLERRRGHGSRAKLGGSAQS